MYVSSECMYPGGCDDKPFLKRQMVVASSMVVGPIGWTNKMCLGGKGWMFDVLSTMILNSIILVDCVKCQSTGWGGGVMGILCKAGG
jgi:hypothetical protein